MLIDWFTVIAQIVNFLILVLLLRRFLYRPVLNAIEARKNKIAAEVQAAENLRAAAEKIKGEYELKIESLESERNTLIAAAREEALMERDQRMEEVKQETEALRQRLMQSFNDQQQAIEKRIGRKAREEVLAITRKVFSDLASKDLEEFIIEGFLRQLETSEKETWQSYIHHNKKDAARIVVCTAFELQLRYKQRIAEVLNKTTGLKDIQLVFRVKSDLVCGIELQINDYTLDWNFASYHQSIHEKLNQEDV
ncbi:F0F1 ATP synthase subunit delta [Agriterribacter sp.]|uniref:F0F1 ATP synthase subunit delta n=1 Tax=Agriterribacter sp. TaxID=2821509 RepID=UPI002BA2EDDA|nr:F0F1 ATP synthase subunit delta [Agriterribacter sp.]HRP57290.1 F0F1 ATP synthase subunit delta [Agriterribacter sp.]